LAGKVLAPIGNIAFSTLLRLPEALLHQINGLCSIGAGVGFRGGGDAAKGLSALQSALL
jgi:hypothetical protein